MLSHLFIKIANRISPSIIWRLLAIKSKKFFKEPYFILSFDCDTEKDIEVSLYVHKKLQAMGITPVYAVPGELLKKGKDEYSRIHQTGAEFINHGGREHTYFDFLKKRDASCFFYEQQSLDVLIKDIQLGHESLKSVLGIDAQGWRTPHFGTFQKPGQLNFIYEILKEMNYQFSTSTIPKMAYIHGPLYKKNGIFEIPVTGVYSEPFNIMDTWAYFAAPDRVKKPSDYLETARELSQFASQYPILINIYGDPSHIYDKSEFFEAMQMLAERATNINYSQLLEITHENLRSV